MKSYARPPYCIRLPNGKVAGSDSETIEAVADHLNFKLDVQFGEGWWGQETVNGTTRLFGTMPDTLLGRTQFAGAKIILLENLWPMFDYMWHMSVDNRFITGKPKVLPPYLNMFLPFSLVVWILFWVTMVIASLTFYRLCYYYGYRDGFISFVAFFMHPFGYGKS